MKPITKESIPELESKPRIEGYPVSQDVRFSAAQKLQALRQSILTDPFISDELAYYVPPHGQSMAISPEGVPLQPWIEREFLHSDARVLLLQGPGGAGKSTFNRYLCRQLWRDPAWSEWKPGAVPPIALAPVFIPLGSAEVEPRRLLHYLTHLPEPLASFTEEELNVLKSDYALLLIADGYDEIPHGCQLNLYDVNSLERYAGRIKLLISRRDSVEMSDQSFVPHTCSGQSEYRYYRVRYLSPFNESQRSDYLTQYLTQNKDREDVLLWPKASDYLTQFKSIPGLDALIGTPFMLCIAAEALPGIMAEVEQEVSLEEKARGTDSVPPEPTPSTTDDYDKELKYTSPMERKEKEQKTISVGPGSAEKKMESIPTTSAQPQQIVVTRLRLYHQFMSQWFERQAKKAREAKEGLSKPEGLLGEEAQQIRARYDLSVPEETLATAYLKQAYLRFCQQLALHLHAEQRVRVQYPPESKRRGLSKVSEEIKTSVQEPEFEWVKVLFGSEEADWRRVRQGCPLQQSAAREHEFLHASLIDYFVATLTLEQVVAFTETSTREEKSCDQTPTEPAGSVTPSLVSVTALTESPKKARRGLGVVRDALPATALRLPNEHPEFLKFLVDDIKIKNNSAYYHDQVLRSKTDKSREASYQASNAATVLNACQVNFYGLDWKNVCLPGADLRYGLFAYSDLSGANLRGAALAHTVWYQAKLEGADLREVEWGEWPRLQCPGINALCSHPTQPWVAVGLGYGKGIALLDIQTGKTIGSLLTENTTSASSMAFSPDGRRLVSGQWDGTVQLWDVETQKPIGKPMIGDTTKWAKSVVAFSPDSRRVASGGRDKSVRLWDVETQELIGEPMIGHTDEVYSLAFSPDGRQIVSGGGFYDNTLRLWDVETRQLIGKLSAGFRIAVYSVAFSPDGRRLASSSFKEVQLWDVETQKPIGKPLIGHTEGVHSVAFSPDGRQLVSGSSDKTVRLWDVETQQPIGEPFTGHTEWVTNVIFSPDGQLVISSDKGIVRIWNVKTPQLIGKSLVGHFNSVNSVAFSPDGRRVASGGGDKSVRLWDVETQQSLGNPLTRHDANVSSVAFTLDGRRVVSGGWDGSVQLWDVETQQLIGKPLIGNTEWVKSVAFSPDGRRVASGGEDKSVRLWDVETSVVLSLSDGYSGKSSSPDGRRVASSGGEDKSVRPWGGVETVKASVVFSSSDGYSGKSSWLLKSVPHQLFIGHKDEVNSVAFSLDGRYLASGSHDKTVRLWNMETQQIGEPLIGHTDRVVSVAFSPDSRLLASGSDDGTIRLWDVERQQLVQKLLTEPMLGVYSVAFSPDGRRLVSVSDGNLQLWEVATGRCLMVFYWHFPIYSIAIVTPSPTLPDEKVMASQVIEDRLVIGDAAGVISFWAISRQNNSIRFINMPRHRNMPLSFDGAKLSGCRVDPRSQHLLMQYGANIEEVLSEDAEEKSTTSSLTFVRAFDQETQVGGESLGISTNSSSSAYLSVGVSKALAFSEWSEDRSPYYQKKEITTKEVVYNRSLPASQESQTFLQSGNTKFSQGDFAGAISDYTQAIELEPQFAMAYFQRGNATDDQGDYVNAINDYTKAIELQPEFANAYVNRGLVKLKQSSDYKGAIDDYTRAIVLQPESFEAYFNRGLALAKRSQGDSAEAIRDLTKAIELQPEAFEVYFNRGLVRRTQGDYAGAISDYSKTIELWPEHVEAYFGRGVVKKIQGDFAGAISDYTQAIKLQPDFANAYINRGLVKRTQGDYVGAISDYTQAIGLIPDDALAYLNRGAARRIQGDFAGAIDDYTIAIVLQPGGAAAYFNRGVAEESQGDSVMAMDDYTQAITLNPEYADPYVNRGNIKERQGDYAGAMDDYTTAIMLQPEDAEAYFNRGNAKFNHGDFAGAISDCTQAIVFQPEFVMAYLRRGQARTSQRDFARAIDDYTRAIELQPEFADAYYHRGLTYYIQDNMVTALKDYTKAVRLKPDLGKDDKDYPASYEKYLKNLSSSTTKKPLPLSPSSSTRNSSFVSRWVGYRSRSSRDSLLQQAEQLLDQMHSPEAIGDQALMRQLCLIKLDDFRKRLDTLNKTDKNELKQLVKALRNLRAGQIVAAESAFGRGLVQAVQGDYTEAIIEFTEAIVLWPEYVDAYYNRGGMKGIQGDYEGAIVDYTKAIKLQPKLTEAYIDRGLAKANQHDFAGAVVDYTKAIELKPEFVMATVAYMNRGLAKVQQNDYAGAIIDCTQAITLHPEAVEAYVCRGDARASQHDYAGAILDYKKAITLKPEHADSYNNLAWAKCCTGDYQGAIVDYSKAIRLQPKHALYYNNRALLYELLGKLEESQTDRREAAFYEPEQYTSAMKLNFANEYKKWADLLNSRGAHAQALVGYHEAIRLNPAFAEAYYHRGLAYYLQDNTAAAIKDYTEAVCLKPGLANKDGTYQAAYTALKKDLTQLLPQRSLPSSKSKPSKEEKTITQSSTRRSFALSQRLGYRSPNSRDSLLQQAERLLDQVYPPQVEGEIALLRQTYQNKLSDFRKRLDILTESDKKNLKTLIEDLRYLRGHQRPLHTQFFLPISDKKASLPCSPPLSREQLLEQVHKLLNTACPPHASERSDLRRDFLKQLAEYKQTPTAPLTAQDQLTLQEMMQTLREIKGTNKPLSPTLLPLPTSKQPSVPLTQFFPPASSSTPPKAPPPERKIAVRADPLASPGQDLLKEVRGLLNDAYPLTVPEHHDNHEAYAFQLNELEKHSHTLSPTEMSTLRGIYKTLQSVLAQRSTSTIKVHHF